VRQSSKKQRGGQAGPKPLKLAKIPVVDPHGDLMTVYEREFLAQIPATQIERKQVIYELSSGERVQLLDEDTFILPSTGARFSRVRS
jgi:hypothetical protein